MNDSYNGNCVVAERSQEESEKKEGIFFRHLSKLGACLETPEGSGVAAYGIHRETRSYCYSYADSFVGKKNNGKRR